MFEASRAKTDINRIRSILIQGRYKGEYSCENVSVFVCKTGLERIS